MKKLLFVVLIAALNYSHAESYYYPNVQLSFPNGIPDTIYKGETQRIPVHMDFFSLSGEKCLYFPIGTRVERVSGTCPAIPHDLTGVYWGSHVCTMNLVVTGQSFDKPIKGNLLYRVVGSDGNWPHKHDWNLSFKSPYFFIRVIPHPLSLSNIPLQDAVANEDFIYPIKPVIHYYDENIEAGNQLQVLVTPSQQDGLVFDPNSLSLIGKPARTGAYIFHVSVMNVQSSTEDLIVQINVASNGKDKPLFKKIFSIDSAIKNTQYSLNLLDLLQENPSFMVSNQISFRVDNNRKHPEWLKIPKENPTILSGKVPPELTQKEVELSLIAHSNTGGDSERVTIKIPIV
jgi:hypothetical protein